MKTVPQAQSVQSALNALEGWVQEELAARRRMLALLEAQESAVKRNHGGEIEANLRAIETELAQQSVRDVRRAKLFDALAGHWNVAGDVLTLSSIAERAGARGAGEAGGSSGARLARLRDELAASTREVVRRNRRLNALLNAHQKVIEELLGALIAIQGGDARNREGALVDARG